MTVEWILDTHPHADHLTAAQYMKEKLGAPIAIGEHVRDVQALWKEIYNLPDFPADGSQWDRLFADGETFRIGSLDARVMHSPGHTLASITYVVGDAAFVHDTLFQPDFGTARSDFPGGSADELYRSIQAILALPEETRLFTGHDYMPGGRRGALGEHGRRAEAREHPPEGQSERGGVRGDPQRARCDAHDAAADSARAAGEHEWRAAAGAGGERKGLSQDSDRGALSGRRVRLDVVFGQFRVVAENLPCDIPAASDPRMSATAIRMPRIRLGARLQARW